MSYNLIKFVQEEIDSGKGEIGRLQFILNLLKEDKPLYLCDQEYLEVRISNHAKKTLILEGKTGNVLKNNKNQNTVMMTNPHDYNTKSRRAQQTMFLNKPEIFAQPDIQKTIFEVRKKLQNVLERIERLETNLHKESKHELITPELEQVDLSSELHDFIETQKLNNKVESFEKNKQKMDKNFLTVAKILTVMTIVTIAPTLVSLWFFGNLQGKLTWQNHEITYSDVSTLLHSFLFVILFIFMAWPALVIISAINNKRTNKSQVKKIIISI